MKRLVALLTLVLLAGPAIASSRQTATVLTFYYVGTTANATQLRDALLWRQEQAALGGAIIQAAKANLALTDIGGGNSEVSIAMPRTAGDAWVLAYATAHCSDVSTVALQRACADAGIKADLLALWSAYRAYLRDQSTPLVEPTLP